MDGRFASTVEFYFRYRQLYPAALYATVAERIPPDRDTLLDVGVDRDRWPSVLPHFILLNSEACGDSRAVRHDELRCVAEGAQQSKLFRKLALGQKWKTNRTDTVLDLAFLPLDSLHLWPRMVGKEWNIGRRV
jgi:hypothetical protein